MACILIAVQEGVLQWWFELKVAERGSALLLPDMGGHLTKLCGWFCRHRRALQQGACNFRIASGAYLKNLSR